MPGHPSYHNSYAKQGLFFKSQPPHQQMPNRSIISNIPDEQVCANGIKTYKYTPLNFVPKNLMVQFSKVANLYFLIIGIMQMVPSISVSGGFPVIFIPLSIVVGVSAIKDFYEDLKRKKSDEQINGMTTQIVNVVGGLFTVRWCDLRIGNIIKVEKDQQFPADVILLCTSEASQNCFIETKNLDGETNLKNKKVRPEISSVFVPHVGAHGENLTLQAVLEEFKYERPNPYIHSFTGSYKGCPLDNNNIVLRGCSLKITKWVYGLAVYTGIDSKIMLNSNKTRQKKSRLQFKMGLIVAAVFLVQMALTFFCAFMSTMLSRNRFTLSDWIDFSTTNELMVKWGSWILLFTNFVPISLIVSLEMVKYIQGINISNSRFVTTAPSSVSVQTSTLNQQLGQIQHVFSDKTGTLTKNYMSFKHMSIGYRTFGYDTTPSIIPSDITNVDFHDTQFMSMLSRESITPGSNPQIFDMLLSFALCHNVIIEQQQQSNQRVSSTPKYNASSPDQLAFINMARYCGFEYQGLDADNVASVRYRGRVLRYRFLHTIEFNSDRKRMAVIVEQLPAAEGDQKQDEMGNRIVVYVKGADNVIVERLRDRDEERNKKLKVMKERLEEWSVNGLRTLVFAKREIKKQYYLKWAKMYAYSLSKLDKLEKQQNKDLKKTIIASNFASGAASAPAAIDDRNNKEGPEKFVALLGRLVINDFGNKKQEQNPTVIINKLLNDNSVLTQSQKKFLEQHLSDMDSTPTTSTTKELEQIIEKELQLIGATAIEDRLQDNVKLTIERLREAGVKVWMLTGDKKQTAINIGISCGLISQDMALVKWKQNIDDTLQQRSTYPSDRDCCLVVTGEDLLRLTQVQEPKLLQLVNMCKSVICCRVTPKQKQDMVWLMRKNRCTTLGIGDGANDVNMINTAHVGVGIKGVQGAQAALCSDYAITQFQILGELMLYHGRQAYRKNSQLILFNFYKNLILVLPQLWYGMNNYFSSANIYDPWIYQLYNVVYTSLPIAIFAIYDERFNSSQSLHSPQLYLEGLENKLFNFRHISLWFLLPIVFSFFLATLTFLSTEQTVNSNGLMFDMVSSGMAVFAQCVIICNIRVLTMSFRYSLGLVLSVLLGIVGFWVSMAMAARIFGGEILNMVGLQMDSPEYWALLAMNVGLVCLVELAMVQWRVLGEKTAVGRTQEEIELPLIGSQGTNGLG